MVYARRDGFTKIHKMNVLILIVFYLCVLTKLEANIKFSSKHAYYNGKNLILKESISLENSLGILKAEHGILERSENKNIPFASFLLNGGANFFFKKGGELFCDRIEGDLALKKVLFFGAPEIRFSDKDFTLCAKKGELLYEEREGGFEVKLLTLREDIRMIRDGQRALADRVEYFPNTDEVHFIGNNAPVLFIDETRRITISAERVIAKDRGREVRGIGSVRFKLEEEELKKFNEKFTFGRKT